MIDPHVRQILCDEIKDLIIIFDKAETPNHPYEALNRSTLDRIRARLLDIRDRIAQLPENIHGSSDA